MNEWISVKDRLPNCDPFPSEIVLVSCNDSKVFLGYANKGKMLISCNHCSEERTITHWMSLPEPPKE